MFIGKKQKSYLRGTPKPKTGLTFSVLHKVIPLTELILTMQVATQKCARELLYNTSIFGKPLFVFRNEPFYGFWGIGQAYISSLSAFDKSSNDIIYKNFKLLIPGIIIAVSTYYVLVFVRNTLDKNDTEFLTKNKIGNEQDLKNSGCLDTCGVVIGQKYDAVINATMKGGSVNLQVLKTSQLVQFNMNVCAMLMAGSRLGKGVSTVIPTLINFPYSLITIDPKAENYEITAGWRSKFSYIYKFCPVSKDTLCFNVLDEIQEDNAFRDANMIAQILTAPTNPEANADPHWQETAKVLITATILHCLCSEYEDKSLPGVYKYLAQANQDPNDKGDAKKKLLQNMIKGTHCKKEIHASIVNYASQIMSAADEEMGSIFSSALEALSIFNDDKVAYASSTSDFCLNDFKYSETPISWYLTIPFADLDRLKSLLRLYIEFVCRKFSQDMVSHGDQPLRNRILFLIDEFPTLGKMETIETFAGILNGYGISFLWICQSKAQIDKLYGQNAPILEHCRFIWFYAISDDNIAEYFSKRIGSEGVIKQNTSSSGNKFDLGMNNISVNSDITERRIITANELESLPPDSEILITQGQPTQILKKVAYYSDPRFMDKVRLPKPITRKDLLKECEASFVVRNDEDKWYKDFSNANQNNYENEIYESDLGLDADELDESDITEDEIEKPKSKTKKVLV